MKPSEFEAKLMTLVSIWKCYGQSEINCPFLSSIEREIEDLITQHLKIRFKGKGEVLSFMERVCFSLLIMGQSQKQIAGLLNSSTYAIESYARQIRKKLKAQNQIHATYLALLNGVLDLKVKKGEIG